MARNMASTTLDLFDFFLILHAGDIVHLCIAGTHIVVLNTFDAVNDLLERRSTTYSDRPRMVMLKEVSVYDLPRSMPRSNE